MAKIKCYHVKTAAGEVYGVAAVDKYDALRMTQGRLSREESHDVPQSAQHVAMWEAEYGTVLHY